MADRDKDEAELTTREWALKAIEEARTKVRRDAEEAKYRREAEKEQKETEIKAKEEKKKINAEDGRHVSVLFIYSKSENSYITAADNHGRHSDKNYSVGILRI